MVWCGQGRAGPGDRSPPRASSRLIPPWGREAGALQAVGGKLGGSRAQTERSLPPTLVHTADLGRPQPGWLRWGTCRGFSFALEPGVLTLSLIPNPSPLLQDDVSTARRGLMGSLANRVAGGAQVLQGGGGSQWDWGAGAGECVRAFSLDCNLRAQGNCGGWGGSWKAVEGVGNKRDIGRIEKLDARGREGETSTKT